MIRLDSVSKSYREAGRERPVLDRVSLEVARGEMVCLMGRSGSGKSTLLNVISGIDTPDSGQVVWGGEDLARLGDRERTLHRRRYLGFVFQFFNLIPTLSVRENVRLPLELNRLPDEGRVERWLDRIGLADRGASFPDALSGGEQQRVALARALVHEPVLLLADEPTGNLDADTADGLLELFRALGEEQGVSLLIATHGAEIARAADRVFTLDHGRLRPRVP